MVDTLTTREGSLIGLSRHDRAEAASKANSGASFLESLT
jgi:hypothetical protein